jgi:hypothetical protein
MSAPHGEHEAFEVHQEADVVGARSLIRVALAAVAIGVLGVLFSALLLETNTGGIRIYGGNRAATSAIAHVQQTPILGKGEGQEMRAAQRAALSRYGWIDRDAGVAAIPIERAMDLVEHAQGADKEPK